MSTNSGGRRESLLSNEPKFFKIILTPRADHLRIPIKFMRKYGQSLPNRVFVKDPSGSVLEVGLVQSNGETLLQKGWKEFKERYSIGFGYLLVLVYDGSCQFDVSIFDITGLEINYPNCPPDADFAPRVGIGENLKDSDDKIGGEISPVMLDNPLTRWQQNTDRTQKQRAVAKETSVAYRTATAFAHVRTRCDPLCISLMQPSYVSGRFILNVSFKFAKESLPGEDTDVTVEQANGKKWPMKCRIRDYHAKLHTGWKEFVQYNALKVGDVCIFEVAERSEPKWNVTIFHDKL